MNEYEVNLRVELGRDPRVARLLILIHVFAWLVAVVFPLPSGLTLLLVAVVAVSLVWNYRQHVSMASRGAIQSISVSRDGIWRLTRNRAMPVEDATLRSVLMTSRWVILAFGVGRYGRQSVVLSSAVIGRERLRQLRARVRATGSGCRS